MQELRTSLISVTKINRNPPGWCLGIKCNREATLNSRWTARLLEEVSRTSTKDHEVSYCSVRWNLRLCGGCRNSHLSRYDKHEKNIF